MVIVQVVRGAAGECPVLPKKRGRVSWTLPREDVDNMAVHFLRRRAASAASARRLSGMSPVRGWREHRNKWPIAVHIGHQRDNVVGDSGAILEEYLDIGRTCGKHTLVAAEVDVILQVVASVYDTCLNCGGKGTADKKRSQQGAAEGNIEVELYIRSGGGRGVLYARPILYCGYSSFFIGLCRGSNCA